MTRGSTSADTAAPRARAAGTPAVTSGGTAGRRGPGAAARARVVVRAEVEVAAAAAGADDDGAAEERRGVAIGDGGGQEERRDRRVGEVPTARRMQIQTRCPAEGGRRPSAWPMWGGRAPGATDSKKWTRRRNARSSWWPWLPLLAREPSSSCRSWPWSGKAAKSWAPTRGGNGAALGRMTRQLRTSPTKMPAKKCTTAWAGSALASSAPAGCPGSVRQLLPNGRHCSRARPPAEGPPVARCRRAAPAACPPIEAGRTRTCSPPPWGFPGRSVSDATVRPPA